MSFIKIFSKSFRESVYNLCFKNQIRMVACKKEEGPCQQKNKCSKKYGQCPAVPKATPEEVESDCEQEIPEVFCDRIEPTPPKFPPNPGFCDTVEKRTGEVETKPTGCCKKPKR